jgi:hypothetical protein
MGFPFFRAAPPNYIVIKIIKDSLSHTGRTEGCYLDNYISISRQSCSVSKTIYLGFLGPHKNKNNIFLKVQCFRYGSATRYSTHTYEQPPRVQHTTVTTTGSRL